MKTMQKFFMVALMAAITVSVSAQQVTTLYFLENAPMRHTINPAFQPVSNGYINFTPIGWMNLNEGSNSYTFSDFFLKDPNDPTRTITFLNKNAANQRTQFLNSLPSMTLVNGGFSVGLINMGFRINDNGYFTLGVNQRINTNVTLPRTMLQQLLGNVIDLTAATIDMNGMGAGLNMYTEVGFGYSHKINDQWTVGGKAKVLMGQGYMNVNGKQMGVATSTDLWVLTGNLDLDIAAPVNTQALDELLNGKPLPEVIDMIQSGKFDVNKLFDAQDTWDAVKRALIPSGYGAAFDLGFTYKPLKQLQISAAITDLGFIYWMNPARYTANMNATFTGVGEVDFGDPKYKDEQGNFSADLVAKQAVTNLENMLNGITVNRVGGGAGTAKMITSRLNIGVDGNFWDNRVGVGVVSATRLYNAHLYEEVTLGAAFRPVNWFNIAVSYSLLENGKYSNIGAGLSFMPYDGINMTLAMDYIPTSYAAIPNKNAGAKALYLLPDKTKMFNVALGFSIVWGTNRHDKDHDGVWDKIDMCPNTPRGVEVDSVGCPLDEDHDGVPDYLDYCLGTPEAAIGHVDSVGCPKDSDGDGVPDYLDKCPGTPEEAWGKVDSVGCPLDSDGDGVADYLDLCPDTPESAWGKVDATGCPIDSDGDGVPDYLDECPNTPEAASGRVDSVGCPIDSDGDGVPDYMDECPDTPKEVNGKVDEKGCILDSDGDGVPDYLDECPFVIGVAENKGCPEVKREVRQLLNKAMQGIQFETGKATIKASSHQILDLIANIFIENSNYIVEVQGHTDATGKYEQNVKISQQRADAVMKYLINKGVPAERLSAKGYGPDVPIADNKTKAGRAKNRRVEFKISFEEIRYESYMDRVEQPVENAAEQAPADTTKVAQ